MATKPSGPGTPTLAISAQSSPLQRMKTLSNEEPGGASGGALTGIYPP